MGMVQRAIFKKDEKYKKMTNKETVERNIGLTFDFVRYLMDNPGIVEKLPDHFELEFLEKDFPVVEKKEQDVSGTGAIKKYVRVKNSFELAG
jgi:hypothetical protein